MLHPQFLVEKHPHPSSHFIGQPNFCDKLEPVAERLNRVLFNRKLSARGSWIWTKKASKVEFLNRKFNSKSSTKQVEPRASAELSRVLVLSEKRFRSNSHGLAMVSSSQLVCVGANPTGLAMV